jgi:hypothetical protein
MPINQTGGTTNCGNAEEEKNVTMSHHAPERVTYAVSKRYQTRVRNSAKGAEFLQICETPRARVKSPDRKALTCPAKIPTVAKLRYFFLHSSSERR